MVDEKVIEAVSLFRTTLEAGGLLVSNLILFGSSASGMLRPGSDIDLAVISDDFTGKDIFTRTRMTQDAELKTIRKFRIALDIITLTPDEYNDRSSQFLNNIRKGTPVISTPAA